MRRTAALPTALLLSVFLLASAVVSWRQIIAADGANDVVTSTHVERSLRRLLGPVGAAGQPKKGLAGVTRAATPASRRHPQQQEDKNNTAAPARRQRSLAKPAAAPEAPGRQQAPQPARKQQQAVNPQLDGLLSQLVQQDSLQPDVLQQVRLLIQDQQPAEQPGSYGGPESEAFMQQQAAELDAAANSQPAAPTPPASVTPTAAVAQPSDVTAAGTQQSTPAPTPACLPFEPDGHFNVLAVGDSITQGAVMSLNRSIPYAIQLTKRLKDKIGVNANVLDAGLGGGGLFRQGIHRKTTFIPFVHSFLDRQDNRHPWDLVIMMVGINDLLAGGMPAAAIASSLEVLVTDILNRGIPIILLPPLAAPGFVPRDDPKEAQRVALAAAYKQMAEEQRKRSRPGEAQLWVLDLQAGPLDFNAMPPEDLRLWLEDGLHLSPYGYAQLGDLIYDEVKQHLCLKKKKKRK